jgi:tetratricopeptide (TPR) repeat protein
MLSFALTLLIAVQASTQPAQQDEVKEGLLRAESLFYEAKFIESIQLLAHVNDVLQTKPGRLPDKVATKLQLALANIGLNDTASAKTFLNELYALDPDYVLDVKQFSPKVVTLANDAKNEQNKIRCLEAMDNARRSVASGDAVGILALLRSMKPKCPDLAQVEPDTAELLYKTGLANYKKNELAAALQAFRAALSLAPKHELAAQYLDLTENKLQVALDRLTLQWQKNFDSRQYKEAAADYRELRSIGADFNPKIVSHMTTEYRNALTPLVDTWNRNCLNSDAVTMAQMRSQITEMIPEPSFGEDIRSKMLTCVPVENPAVPRTVAKIESKTELPGNRIVGQPEPKPPVATGSCLAMDPQLALTRLKTRVEPEIPREARAYIQNSQIAVRLKARIDQSGNVTVSEVNGINVILNNAIRAAVEKWKFSPIIDASGPRCVDTDILVMVGK